MAKEELSGVYLSQSSRSTQCPSTQWSLPYTLLRQKPSRQKRVIWWQPLTNESDFPVPATASRCQD
jgi:hypothetical protein